MLNLVVLILFLKIASELLFNKAVLACIRHSVRDHELFTLRSILEALLLIDFAFIVFP